MSIASQEALRNRLTVTGLAVCMVLAAMLQLNGRSLLSIGQAHGKDAGYAALTVQPGTRNKVASAAGVARGPIGRLLERASRAYAPPPSGAAASAPAAVAALTPGMVPEWMTPPDTDTPATTAAVPGTGVPGASGGNAGGTPPSPGDLLLQTPPVSGPVGVQPGTPTPQPTATPVPQPTTPVTPTTPISPVPEPAAWAMLIAGLAMAGGMIRRRGMTSAAPVRDGGSRA